MRIPHGYAGNVILSSVDFDRYINHRILLIADRDLRRVQHRFAHVDANESYLTLAKERNLDGIIVILGAIFTKNPNNMLFAIIVIFVSTKVSETILVGIEKSKLCIIISDKGEAISDALIEASPRGVTMLDGEGMYTRSAHNVLLTCVKNRQLSQLKQIVNSVDPGAFIIINDSVEVRGKGFRSLQDKD